MPNFELHSRARLVGAYSESESAVSVAVCLFRHAVRSTCALSLPAHASRLPLDLRSALGALRVRPDFHVSGPGHAAVGGVIRLYELARRDVLVVGAQRVSEITFPEVIAIRNKRTFVHGAAKFRKVRNL
jgi:hypothetical protein